MADRVLAATSPPDLAAWHDLLWPEAHLRIGNRPLALGREAALVEIGWLLEEVAMFGRGFREIWPGRDGPTVLMELDAVRCDGVTMPLVIVLRALSPEPPVRDIRFYIDLSGLKLNAPQSPRRR